MKRLRAFNTALAVTLAACMASAAGAGAEESGNPLILPEPTASQPLKFTSTTGKVILKLEGIPLECLTGSSFGEFTSKRLGKISVSFNRCEANNPPISCHTEGDSKGVVLLPEAELHLVAYKEGGGLRAAFVITLAKTIKVLCSFGTFEWKGSIFASLSGVSGKTKTATFAFSSTEECELDKEFCFEGSSHRKFRLESSNGTGFEPFHITREDSVTFSKEVTFDF